LVIKSSESNAIILDMCKLALFSLEVLRLFLLGEFFVFFLLDPDPHSVKRLDSDPHRVIPHPAAAGVAGILRPPIELVLSTKRLG
jgi:hypothetical protein